MEVGAGAKVAMGRELNHLAGAAMRDVPWLHLQVPEELPGGSSYVLVEEALQVALPRGEEAHPSY